MKDLRILYFILVGLMTFSLNPADAQEPLAQQAYNIFQNNCLNCHGVKGPFTENLVIDTAAKLIQTGAVVPGNPLQSSLYTRLLETNPIKRMPLAQPPLTPAAIETIANWIRDGASDWQVQRDVAFIPPHTMLTHIETHLASLSDFARPFARYFTMTHLYNAGELPENLNDYKIALSKLVNSLSWGYAVKNPQPIDPEQTIFYIDLRDYEWDIRGDAWTQIESIYPYTIEFDPETQPELLGKMTRLRQEMDCQVPFVHVDWFLATAALPPLYHNILDLPVTDRQLEQELDVDVDRNIANAPGVRVWRAGFNDSGVSLNNRVVERHTSRYGAYWKSYDFAGSIGAQNVLTHPLSFQHDGGEIIFNLPNGLQAYYISDAEGRRIDAAPINIVSNPAASDPVVYNGLSCIGCHTEGMKTFEDEVRAAIHETANPRFDKAQALRLYAEQDVMDAWLDADKQRFQRALIQTGSGFDDIEPVHRFYEVFLEPLEAPEAAAAVGLETNAFLSEIGEKPILQNLGLTGMLSGGNVQRDTWTQQYQNVIAALNSQEMIPLPPTPDTETTPPRPGSFHIPDANLRAAIAETLGKAPGALITQADMQRLRVFRADDKGIRDLTGLESATNLERIELRRNEISDLTPIAGLTRLNNIKLRGNRIRDISPLAELTNVDWLGLEENAITDLSPLNRLIKLDGIGISGNPITNLAPLARLVSLERIDAWRTPITDFTPLAELPRLSWIEFGNEGSIEAIPTLTGLNALRRLQIDATNISDLSPLSELTQLEWLRLVNNTISDVAPLANLKRLKHLNLDANIISDIAPLAELSRLEILYLENNVISDPSALIGLKNLERLDLRNNAISDFSSLEGLPDTTLLRVEGNPGVPSGGPKITGPWLWVIVPGTELNSNTDFLAIASRNATTELKVATNGAKEGKAVGEGKWRLHRLAASGGDNINQMTEALGWGSGSEIYDHIIYGSVILDSPQEQQTTMFVGSDDAVKVWLNGELVHSAFVTRGANDYQDFFPATLKSGKNVLLVALDNRGHGGFSGFFGFAPDAKYTVFRPSMNFVFETDTTPLNVGDEFTLHLNVENVTDFGGWQADLTFDPTVLKAMSVTEGDFLKQDDGETFFQEGTLKNPLGKVIGIKSLQLDGKAAKGQGRLLSVTCTAIGNGTSQLTLDNFLAGTRRGEKTRSIPPEMTITVGGTRTAPEAAEMLPDRTALLMNYPNPFNPETWIPYQLTDAADVTVTIYDIRGVRVRQVAVGHQPAGFYQRRSRAAYWDGRNTLGERVASGLYFYTLTAGDFTATRKMLIRK